MVRDGSCIRGHRREERNGNRAPGQRKDSDKHPGIVQVPGSVTRGVQLAATEEPVSTSEGNQDETEDARHHNVDQIAIHRIGRRAMAQLAR